MNITLIGYRGSGKSTVARLLAQRIGWDWVDADSLIEERAGRTIRQIFESEGEPGFRLREADVMRELAGRDRLVIAAGGGAVLSGDNRRAMRQSGFTIWLVASPEMIERRIAADPTTSARRPALTAGSASDEVRHLLQSREPYYRDCADLIVETDGQSPDNIAEVIARAVSDRIAPPQSE